MAARRAEPAGCCSSSCATHPEKFNVCLFFHCCWRKLNLEQRDTRVMMMGWRLAAALSRSSM